MNRALELLVSLLDGNTGRAAAEYEAARNAARQMRIGRSRMLRSVLLPNCSTASRS